MALKSHVSVLSWRPYHLELLTLFGHYGLQIKPVVENQPIPGSFWGDSEAGLVANELYLRCDTPLHSALHEACHYLCMDAERRAGLDTNAGGDELEECAVCYLQVIIGEQLTGVTRQRLFSDMDNWGYSFRLGSTQAWFEKDAEDAITWLQQYELIDGSQRLTGKLRTQ